MRSSKFEILNSQFASLSFGETRSKANRREEHWLQLEALLRRVAISILTRRKLERFYGCNFGYRQKCEQQSGSRLASASCELQLLLAPKSTQTKRGEECLFADRQANCHICFWQTLLKSRLALCWRLKHCKPRKASKRRFFARQTCALNLQFGCFWRVFDSSFASSLLALIATKSLKLCAPRPAHTSKRARKDFAKLPLPQNNYFAYFAASNLPFRYGGAFLGLAFGAAKASKPVCSSFAAKYNCQICNAFFASTDFKLGALAFHLFSTRSLNLARNCVRYSNDRK